MDEVVGGCSFVRSDRDLDEMVTLPKATSETRGS